MSYKSNVFLRPLTPSLLPEPGPLLNIISSDDDVIGGVRGGGPKLAMVNAVRATETDDQLLKPRLFSDKLPTECKRSTSSRSRDDSKRKTLSNSLDLSTGECRRSQERCKRCQRSKGGHGHSRNSSSVSLMPGNRTEHQPTARPMMASATHSGHATPSWSDIRSPQSPNGLFSRANNQAYLMHQYVPANFSFSQTPPVVDLMKKPNGKKISQDSVLDPTECPTSPSCDLNSACSSKRPSACSSEMFRVQSPTCIVEVTSPISASTPQPHTSSPLKHALANSSNNTSNSNINKPDLIPSFWQFIRKFGENFKTSTSMISPVAKNPAASLPPIGPRQSVSSPGGSGPHPMVSAAISAMNDPPETIVPSSPKFLPSTPPTTRQKLFMAQLHQHQQHQLLHVDDCQTPVLKQSLSLDEDDTGSVSTNKRSIKSAQKLLAKAPKPRSPDLLDTNRQFNQNLNFYRKHNSTKNSRPSSEFSSPERVPVGQVQSNSSHPVKNSQQGTLTIQTPARYCPLHQPVASSAPNTRGSLSHSVETLEDQALIESNGGILRMEKDMWDAYYDFSNRKNPRLALFNLEMREAHGHEERSGDMASVIRSFFQTGKSQKSRKSFHVTKLSSMQIWQQQQQQQQLHETSQSPRSRPKLRALQGTGFSQSCNYESTMATGSSPGRFNGMMEEGNGPMGRLVTCQSLMDGLNSFMSEVSIHLNANWSLIDKMPNGEAFNKSTEELSRLHDDHELSVGETHEFNIPYGNIKLDECILSGKNKKVYKGQWHGDVIVHTFFDLCHTGKNKFWSEVCRMDKIRHENIALFQGASMEPPYFAIVTSPTKGLSLYETLHKNGGALPKQESKLKVLIPIAQALSYLHAKTKPIVVRKLNSRNIFLEPKVTLCLIDYGDLDCIYETDKFVNISDDAIWYTAPELLKASAMCYQNGESPYRQQHAESSHHKASVSLAMKRASPARPPPVISLTVAPSTDNNYSISQTDSGVTQMCMPTASNSAGSHGRNQQQVTTTCLLPSIRASCSTCELPIALQIRRERSRSCPTLGVGLEAECSVMSFREDYWHQTMKGMLRTSFENEANKLARKLRNRHRVHNTQTTTTTEEESSTFSSSFLSRESSMNLSSDDETEMQSEKSNNSVVPLPSYQLPPNVPRLAPETCFTVETDIFAYGTLMYEIYACPYPFDNLDCLNFIDEVTMGKRHSLEQVKAPTNIKSIIEKAWAHAPNERPTIRKICQTLLQKRKRTNSVPDKLNRITDPSTGFF